MVITTDLLDDFPLTREIFTHIKKQYIIFSKTYTYIMNHFDKSYLSFCEEILSIMLKKYRAENNIHQAINGFIKYSNEFLVLQSKLTRNGAYPFSSFEDINSNVYQHATMNEYYLDGLFLSQILWPNHYKIGQYFINQHTVTDERSIVLDVPCGTGIYSYLIMRYFKYKKIYAYDISPYAKTYTNEVLRYSLIDSKRVEVEVNDVFNLKETRKYDFIVCCELLEHVEKPESLMTILHSLLKPNGKLFLSTAIYAAAIDHIYLFNNVEEVRHLINTYFHINSELIIPLSMEKYRSDMNNIPINYACLLTL